jgi:PIN domain nuclease of toxin-antitoxin system
LTVIIDSFAWIEYLTAGRFGTKVRSVLGGEDLALTPDLVLAEVSRKLARDGVEQNALQAQLSLMLSLTTVTTIDLQVALAIPRADKDLRASARSRGLGAPGLGDATVLATARARGGKVLTGDRHFKDLAETEWLG